MKRRHPRRQADAGETLIELTLAIALMAGAGLVFASSLATAVKGAGLMQGRAAADTVVASAAQTVANEAAVPFNTALNSGVCDPHTAQTAYQTALNAVPPPAGFTTTVTAVGFWEGSAFTSTPSSCTTDRLQRVTVQTTAPDGATRQAAVAKQRALGLPGLTTAGASTGQPSASTISDSVTLSGGASPSGQVAFRLYPLGCTGSPVLTPTTAQTLSGGNAAIGPITLPTTDTTGVPSAGSAASGWETASALTAGTYEWRATYLGDAANGPATTPCGSTTTSSDHQQFLLPTMAVTSPPSLAAAGTTVTYAATLTTTGPTPPTGNISLAYYVSNDCSGTSVGAPVTTAWSPGGTYSPGANTASVPVPLSTALGSTTTTGNYYLLLSYTGDSNYAPSPLACGNLLHVDNLTVALSPTTGNSATPISALATLANPSSPTGTVGFTGFPTGNCSGSGVAIAPTIPVAPNGPAGSFQAPSGTHSVLAAYPGDANNAGATECIPVTIT